MKEYRGFLIDLDGTVYKGTEKIDEAVTFVKQLKDKGFPYLFLTNNSTKHPSDVSDKLNQMGVPSTTDQVFTSSMATAHYIKQQEPNAKVYPVGEKGLHMALEDADLEIVDENADYVVMGLDQTINYEKLAKGALNIRAGATFVATNGDVALPTERGFLPGAGSLISVLSVTTGVEPTFIGKPESIIVDQALEVLGTTRDETLMIGDNYATDILAGINAGIDSLLVHTGVTTKEDLKTIQNKPTYTIDTLAEWTIED
ncbi:hydrolase [Gracilibacillus halophilus YIM-C55.5]|uniref:Acid sugar phosphatase n=1 Tax=Gracilibacillus halophilus YIM-C55.5 TaxID=1308866 RepID=N4WM69_9BACI|nr:TIGR01457 family HAD-type hydrolase [Gracilibacillus halophilus]ENH95590.1 hydrolase [Gracilibacillus halophilus YIM-C55.5]